MSFWKDVVFDTIVTVTTLTARQLVLRAQQRRKADAPPKPASNPSDRPDTGTQPDKPQLEADFDRQQAEDRRRLVRRLIEISDRIAAGDIRSGDMEQLLALRRQAEAAGLGSLADREEWPSRRRSLDDESAPSDLAPDHEPIVDLTPESSPGAMPSPEELERPAPVEPPEDPESPSSRGPGRDM